MDENGIVKDYSAVTMRGNCVTQRKDKKPSINQQPDVDNSVTHARGTANASSDSGYVSTTRVEADTLRDKLTSTKEPTKVSLVAKQQADDEVADSQEGISDQEEAKGGPVDENNYMHELFGLCISSISSNEEQVAPEEYDLFIYFTF